MVSVEVANARSAGEPGVVRRTMAAMLARACAVMSLAIAGCAFTPSGTAVDGDAGLDAVVEHDGALPPDAACAATCDPHATCVGGACVCAEGWTGDGASCVDIDECAVGNGGCDARCVDRDGGFQCYAPASCAELHAQEPTLPDGDYTLYAGGTAWTAICHDLATAPSTYLRFPVGNVNYAQYTRSGAARTTFTAVRIDPASLRIDIDDLRHATSAGTVVHSGTTVASMPYGVAMDCSNANSASGVASIDLTDTPFAVLSPSLGAGFIRGGNSNSGTVTAVLADQFVSIAGGGNCGWIAPTQTPTPSYYNPFNPSQSAPPFTHILQLRLR